MNMEAREGTMFVSAALDYTGAPANRSTTGGWVSAASILVVELCERLSTMAIAVNLVTYLVGTMHLPSSTSSTIITNWSGISYLFSLLGGVLADSFLGRYWTIAIFANIHMLGSCLLAISAVLPNLRPPPCNPSLPDDCIEANGLQMAVFYISLYTIAVGLGGIKCSVSGFGTDQFDEKDEKEKAQMAHFFNRFYFFISIGTLLAVTVFIYIQDRVARVWGYACCSIIMLLAIAIFFSGTRRYSCLDKAAIIDDDDYIMIESGTQNRWRLCSVTEVEEVKMMTRILPIWATTIMYYAIHAQMITFAVLQASTMERSIGSFEIPGASFDAFFIGAILLTLAIHDRLIVPLLKKKKGTLGLFISIIAMVVAAIVEARRLKVAKSTSSTNSILPISAFLLAPQFVLAGAAEGLVYTGQLDFFLSESPKGMKAVSTSLFLTTISFGFFVSSVLVAIIRRVTEGGRIGFLLTLTMEDWTYFMD
ncbi:UNVERIFIED_CONTAM: protein NRT1/ PTR FAMILY 6.2 [Sesamum angustifolium]|uniref:Protein NRT1/ PTR FAMILY 6.2 n=1 Tax=Sesamum angustifolium TaxID=2727405 RepID=A0AAW2N7Z4_9LAMI